MMSVHRQRGAIFIITLLFLWMLSTMMATDLRDTLLETRLSRYFHDYAITFAAAEAGLIAAESALQGRSFILSPFPAHIAYHSQWIHTDECGHQRYRIVSRARYQQAAITLMSEYVWQNPQASEACRQSSRGGRISWAAVSQP